MAKIGKRISIMFICALLIFGSARRAEAAAEAGALSILGGSVAAGGIGAAIAAIAPPAIIIVGIALAAQGIYVAISEESEKLGMTKSDYIGTKLAQFALASGKQYSDVCHDIVDGANVSSTGSIALTTAASKTIYQFANSLVADNQISAPSVAGKYVKIGDVNVPVIRKGESISYVKRDGNDRVLFSNSDSDICVFVSTVPSYGKVLIMLSDVDQIYIGYGYPSLTGGYSRLILSRITPGSMYYANGNNVLANDEILVPELAYQYWHGTVSNWGSMDVQESSGDDGFISESAIDTSVYNPADGNVIVLDPGLDLTALENSYGKTGTIAIDNYLESLKRALDGVESNTIAISDSLTGVLENVAVGVYDPVGSASVDQVAEEELPRVMTPVIDLSLNPSGAAAEKDLQGLAFDLTAIFPFCIPFDLFALIEKFDVQPETPRIQISLPLPGLDETLDLDLDLAPFETVAVILRSMELIAFIIGLALVTRNLIRG